MVSGSFPSSSFTWLPIIDRLCSSALDADVGVSSWSRHTLYHTDHTCNNKQRFVSQLEVCFPLVWIVLWSSDLFKNGLDNGINLSTEITDLVSYRRICPDFSDWSLNGKTILMGASCSSDTCCLEHTFSVTFIAINVNVWWNFLRGLQDNAGKQKPFNSEI